jgi:hypothetical protein
VLGVSVICNGFLKTCLFCTKNDKTEMCGVFGILSDQIYRTFIESRAVIEIS